MSRERSEDHSFQALVLTPSIPDYITHLNLSNNKLHVLVLNSENLAVLNASFNELLVCKLSCPKLFDVHLGYNYDLEQVDLPSSVKILNINNTKIPSVSKLLHSLQSDFTIDPDLYPNLQVHNSKIIKPFIELESLDDIPSVTELPVIVANSAKDLVSKYENNKVDFSKLLEMMSLISE